jgi:hypothetical protein
MRSLGESRRASTSDLDLLVEFEPMTPSEHADSYFGLIPGSKPSHCALAR